MINAYKNGTHLPQPHCCPLCVRVCVSVYVGVCASISMFCALGCTFFASLHFCAFVCIFILFIVKKMHMCVLHRLAIRNMGEERKKKRKQQWQKGAH